MCSAPADPAPTRRRSGAVLALAGFFLFAFALIAARAMTREVSRDEQQFISAGALLNREDLLPYVDFPYFHVPNLVYVYAALFDLCDHLVLIARTFNALCGALTLLLIFWMAGRAFRAAGHARFWVAGAASMTFLASPLFQFASGRAWNHDLAVLAAVAGLCALLRGNEQKHVLRWVAAAAALLGVAIGTRSSFLPLLVPFAAIATFHGVTTRERWMRLFVFSAVTLVSLAPTLLLFARAPAEFLFGNLVYNGPLNRAYRIAAGHPSVDWTSKLLFAGGLLKFPHNLVLLLAFGYLAIWLPARKGWREFVSDFDIGSIAVCIPFLWLGAALPTPSHKQYYYALVPFLLLGCVFGLARVWFDSDARMPRLIALVLTGVSAVALALDLPLLTRLAAVREWPPARLHQLGRELRAHTAGPVLTLSPVIPLEGGAGIYAEFATGWFAWRTASLLSDEAKKAYRMIDADSLGTFLNTAPPPAILTGRASFELNGPLTAYARKHGYRHVELSDGLQLWLRPP